MIVYTLNGDEKVPLGVDIVELRPDRTDVVATDLPYLLTNQEEHLGAAYIDVPFPGTPKTANRWISSFHGPHEGVEKTWALVRAMANLNPDLIKVCFDELSLGQMIHLKPLFDTFSNLILFGRGESGQPTRLISYCWGAPWIYTSGDGYCGQIPLHELLEVYQIKRLSKQTKLYGVLKGEAAPASIGYKIYNPYLAEKKIDALYMTLVVQESEFAEVFLSPLFAGFSITMPYKEKAFQLAKNLDAEAEICRSINTYAGGIGYNTDIEILKELDLVGKKIAILGGGGVATAFAHFLAPNNEVTIFLRNLEKGKAFIVPVKLLQDRLDGFDWIIDTLPVQGVTKSVDFGVAVIDMKINSDPIYNSLKHFVSGKEVFLKQGKKQLLIFLDNNTLIR